MLVFREPVLEAVGSGARGILELECLVALGGRAWTARLALLQVPQRREPHNVSSDWDVDSLPLRLKSQIHEGACQLPEKPFHCSGGFSPLVPGYTHVPHVGLSEAVLSYDCGCHSPDCQLCFMVPTRRISTQSIQGLGCSL